MKTQTAFLSFLLSTCLLFGCIPSGIAASAENDRNDKVYSPEEVRTLEDLRKVPVEQIAGWEKYDSRTYGIVTEVKSQIPYDLCWAYASTAAAETSILREGCDKNAARDTLDLDEIEVAKAVRGKFLDPLGLADGSNLSPTQDEWNSGGYIDFFSRIATHWQGVYQTQNVREDAQRSYSDYVLDGFVKCGNTVGEIKALVAQHGAVAFEYAMGYGVYHYAIGEADHASAIVGWDDTIPRTSFMSYYGLPSRDGAWLVKNSWGTGYHDQGYFWLSYDSQIKNITAFDFSPRPADAFLYNYAANDTSRMWWTSRSAQLNSQYAYVFTPQLGADCTETIDSVCIGVEGATTVQIEIYANLTSSNGKLTADSVPDATANFHSSFGEKAFYTVPLNKKIPLEHDKPFCVKVSLISGAILLDFNGSNGNAKCYIPDGGSWAKLRLSDGQLPVIHPITAIDPEEREKTYGDALYEKILDFEKQELLLGGKGMTAENHEALYELKKLIDTITDAEREKLWLKDKNKLEHYEDMIELWSELVADADSAIELGKKFL